LPAGVRSVGRVKPDAAVPSEPLRKLLRGFPEPAIEACARYQATGSPEVFEEAVGRVIHHYLDKPAVADLRQLPGTTRLVEDLGLDSLTMVEMVFLFEDLFATKIPTEALKQIATLDDLRTLLKAHLPARS
jgi:3-hydroxyacyl-[acyl-carrier-protein] dehydratase